MLQTLQQTKAPVVVAQGIVDTSLALCILGCIDITQDAVFTFLEDFFEFILVDVTYHIGIRFMRYKNALGVGEATRCIGLDDGLHGRLRINLVTVVDLLHVETGLALHCDRDFTDQVVEGRLCGFGVGSAASLAPDIVVISLDTGHFV